MLNHASSIRANLSPDPVATRAAPLGQPGGLPGRGRAALRLGTLAVAVALSACANMSERERGTAQGAALGAVAGAVLGTATGGNAGQGAVLGGAVGAVAGNLWSKRMEDKRQALAQATQGSAIDVSRTADNRIKVNVPSDVSFDVGSAQLRAGLKPVLDELGRNLDPQMSVSVVGHTDSTGSDAVNQPLSVNRAAAVRDYLVMRGVPASRISIGGEGASQPVGSNETAEGRAMNRRVEIYLVERAG